MRGYYLMSASSNAPNDTSSVATSRKREGRGKGGGVGGGKVQKVKLHTL